LWKPEKIMNKSWHDTRLRSEIDWASPPGKLLLEAVEVWDRAGVLPETLVIFGSGPLEMIFPKRGFFSVDLDIGAEPALAEPLRQAGLLQGQRTPYVEICPLHTFQTCPDWITRAQTESVSGCQILFPHPIDILVSKVPRAEAKDLEAFRKVRAATGHPTEEELRHALSQAVDLYRPAFDKESGRSALLGTKVVWKEIFNREIDVTVEIIAPALAVRREHYSPKNGKRLREAALDLIEKNGPLRDKAKARPTSSPA
jgi:hypothetical protein